MAKSVILVCIGMMVLGLTLAGSSQAVIDIKTVAGMWLFDEGDGDVIEDASGNGNDGAIIGKGKWVKGKFGQAIELDGSSFVDCGTGENLNMADEITLVCWVRTTKKMKDTWADRQVVIGKHYLEYELGIYDQGRVHTYTNDGTGGGYDEGIFVSMAEKVDADWELDKWYHLAWTLNKQHEIAYVNGEIIGEYDKGHAGTKAGEHHLNIGQREGGGLNFEGAIDEVAVFNKALEEDDIKLIYEKGLEWALGISPVSPADKAAVTWGNVKAE